MASNPGDELPTQRLSAIDRQSTTQIAALPDLPTTPEAAVTELPTHKLAATAPVSQRRSPIWRRAIPDPRRPYGRLVYALFAFLLLVSLSIPLLRQLAFAQHPLGSHPGATTVATGGHGTGGASSPSLSWLNTAASDAETRYVNKLIAHMTLDEEIGQMIMVEFTESQVTPGIAYEISHYHVGSVILYSYNILTATQTTQLDHDLQANSTIPLMISTDQEGGRVNRLQNVDGYFPPAAQIGAKNDPSYAEQRGSEDAKNLYALGINANMAPVVDVENVPGGSFLGDRIFGSTPDQVTKMAGAYLSGLQHSQHVVGCIKHFPGLGDVSVDPHAQLPTLTRSLSDLQQIDWAPYASLIATGQVRMVMVTHETVPAVDPTLPSSLSKPMITGVLRDQLHFNGVIVTDGIYMKSLAAHYSFDQIVLLAVEAGEDIISSTYSLDSTAEAESVIRDAVTNGTITKQRIDDSVRRILLLKLHYGMLPPPSH